jgi:hypothetical protein
MQRPLSILELAIFNRCLQEHWEYEVKAKAGTLDDTSEDD